MHPFTVLTRANDQRRDQGAARTIAVLNRYFALGDTTGATEAMLTTGRARIEHPGDSLTQLARRLGVTKDAASSRLRRLEKLAVARNRSTREVA